MGKYGNRHLLKLYKLINLLITGCGVLILCLLSCCGTAMAGELSQRLANFPEWQQLSFVKPATGDLIYPDWMAGTWQVTSTLVDAVAPLAPEIVTPGFAGNSEQINEPVSFLVRFLPQPAPITGLKIIPRISPSRLVADRAFNSLNLAKAYVGDEAVLSVKVDPNSPNRQITFLRGDRQLISIVTGRATETTPQGDFITSEVFQQLFKMQGAAQPYLNAVESTTAYHPVTTPTPAIVADQVTAVYLSPQDANYFIAVSRPVALYRYRLEFLPSEYDP